MKYPDSPPPSTQRAAGGRAMAVLALVTFGNVVGSMSLPPFLPAVAEDLDVSIPLLGQIPAASLLLACVLGLVIGPLADHYGTRRALLAGLLTYALSSLGMGLAPSYAALLPAALVGAFGRAIVQPAAQALAGALFAESARRRALGWTQAGSALGATIGIAGLTFVGFYTSWRIALVGLAGLMLLVAGACLFALPADPARRRAGLRLNGILRAYRPLLGHRPTLGLILSSVVGNAGLFMMLTYQSAFFAQQHGFDSREIGLVFSSEGIGLLIGSTVGSTLFHGVPLRLPLVLGLVLRGLLFGGALLLPVAAPVAVLLTALAALFDGVYLVLLATLLTTDSPAGRATTMLLNGSAFSLGSAIGSSLGGLLLALAGFGALGLSVAALSCAAALLAWWFRTSPASVLRPSIQR